MWMYGFENQWGIIATVYASSIFFGLLALIPMVDRKQDRRFSARYGILAFGAIIAVALVGLTLYGYITPAQTHTHHHAHDEKTQPPSETVPSSHIDNAVNHAPHDDHQEESHEGK
jgi:quinol-cytochrome oxidoreductase complex cytochrome b subunit